MSGGMPHICFVAPHAYPLLADDKTIQFAGGAELQQVLIARNLVERGYRVSMVCLDYGQEHIVEIDGIVVYRAFRQEAGLPVLRFFWPRLTNILQCLSRADADIYYQRAASMLTGVVAAFCQFKDRKAIFSVAGDPKIRFARDKWLYRYGVKNVDRIVVQTETQRRQICSAFGRDSSLIPNLYGEDVVNCSRRGRYVLWVGTIRQVKRPDIFLGLVARLPKIRFVMIGGPDARDEELFDSVSSRAAELDNLDFVGYVPYSETGSYFDDAMLFVNTSDSEGFPNTFLQSWARGVPTISFVDSGARKDGLTIGLQVSSLDEMAKSIVDLVDDESRRLRQGEFVRKYIEENHTAEHVVDLYEELIRNMLGNAATK